MKFLLILKSKSKDFINIKDKGSVSIKNVDIDKRVIRQQCRHVIRFLQIKKGFKDFTGYKNAKKSKSLFMFLPKMTACRKDFDESKYISFLIKNAKLLGKHSELWENINSSLRKNVIVIQYTMKNI